jgi:protein-S-isoprenylcysteine O-methyltransferase Ste14
MSQSVGGWLFRQRTWLPLPLIAAILLIPGSQNVEPTPLWLSGPALVLAGEAVRLWAVHHIGAISRTRSDRLGPLISTGPFSLVRNPLYLGNVALWVGFAMSARLLWMAPLILVVLGLEYHAIVRWEEQLLTARLGDSYRAYAARVPRWVPTCTPIKPASNPAAYSWRETFFSERGTLVAIAAGYLLLYAKSHE